MTTPERTIEEKLKSFKYTESDIKLILGIVSPILEAERQKRDEMVEAERERIKIETQPYQEYMIDQDGNKDMAIKTSFIAKALTQPNNHN